MGERAEETESYAEGIPSLYALRPAHIIWTTGLEKVSDSSVDSGRHVCVVHGVDMHPVGSRPDQVPELHDGIVNACAVEALGVVLPSLHHPPEGGGTLALDRARVLSIWVRRTMGIMPAETGMSMPCFRIRFIKR